MDQKTDILEGRLLPVRSRKTVQDQVYEQLRRALVSGLFEAGEPFTIASLADRFQTSHMPVREALRRLAAENALRISASGTAFVPDLGREELEDLIRARVIIEGATAEIAACRMGEDDITWMEANIARHERAGISGETAEMVEANRAFHFHIYERAESPVLLSQIETLWLRFGPYVRFLSDRMGMLLKTDYAARFAAHHVDMVAALRRRDIAAFRRGMEQDIRSTRACRGF